MRAGIQGIPVPGVVGGPVTEALVVLRSQYDVPGERRDEITYISCC